MELLSWQKRWLKDTTKKLIWADTGLGKGVLGGYLTSSSISKGNTVLIISPSHLKGDWESKIKDVNPNISVNIIKEKIIVGEVNILTYKSLQDYEIKGKADFILVDESHRTKNYKGHTFKNLLKIIKRNNPFVLCLSASPITLNRIDMLTQIYLTQKSLREEYPNYYKMLLDVCTVKIKYFGSKSVTTFEDVRKSFFEEIMSKYVFRVTYESEGIERPQYLHKIIKVDISDIAQREIDRFLSEENLLNLGFESDRLLTKISNPHSVFLQAVNGFIYQIDSKEYIECGLDKKIEALRELIDSEKKYLVLNFFDAEKKAIEKLDGVYSYKPHSKKTIEEQIKEFEASKTLNIFSANIASIGEGIRFKKTDAVVIFSEQYDYAKILQALGRIQYVGNDLNRILEAFFIRSNFEFSEKIHQNIQAKIDIINKTERSLHGDRNK